MSRVRRLRGHDTSAYFIRGVSPTYDKGINRKSCPTCQATAYWTIDQPGPKTCESCGADLPDLSRTVTEKMANRIRAPKGGLKAIRFQEKLLARRKREIEARKKRQEALEAKAKQQKATEP